MKRLWIISVLMIVCHYLHAGHTLHSVPNPRLNHTYVSNPDNILSESAVETINQQLRLLERETEVQIAIIALTSIGNNDYTNFSYNLATTWGVGKAEKNTGLLMLLVLDQRAVRIEVGKGLEGLLPDAVCERILQEKIFPAFREGNYDHGCIDGVNSIYTLLTTDEAKAELLLEREYASRRWWVEILIYYLMAGFILLILCAWLGEKLLNARPTAANNIRYAQCHDYMSLCWGLAVLFPLPLLFWALYVHRRRLKIRYTPVTCPECRHKMTLLSEKEEDIHLNKKQQTEENIRSVNYDVWECKHCYNHIILPYQKKRSRYSECAYCHAIACKLYADVVLLQPTQFSYGEGERTYTCHHCGKQFVKTYSIPKLPIVITSGGNRNGGGFSGGSWGGGGFSGGGAGGHF